MDGGSASTRLTEDLIIRIAAEHCSKFRDPRVLNRMERVCKSWRDVFAGNQEPWRALTHERFPRTRSPEVEGVSWGASGSGLTGWKARYRTLRAIQQPVLWVDDRPKSVEHLQRQIEQWIEVRPLKVHHCVSTRLAKQFLQSSPEGFHDCLRVVTDSHRNEEDDAGVMQSNYEAGTQLVTWMRTQGGAWEDVPVMIFCGPGSVPFVDKLTRTFRRVHVAVQESAVLRFCQQFGYTPQG